MSKKELKKMKKKGDEYGKDMRSIYWRFHSCISNHNHVFNLSVCITLESYNLE